MKKNNTQISVNKKNKLAIRKNSKATLSTLAIVILLGLVGVWLYFQYQSSMDKQDVIMMREGVKRIASRLETVNSGMDWRNLSQCTVYEPRLFGDKTRYSCDAAYEASTEVSDQTEIESIVRRAQTALEDNSRASSLNDYPKISRDDSINEKDQSSIVSIDFKLSSVDTEKCDMNYILTYIESRQILKLYLRCYQDTNAAYFKPIDYV